MIKNILNGISVDFNLLKKRFLKSEHFEKIIIYLFYLFILVSMHRLKEELGEHHYRNRDLPYPDHHGTLDGELFLQVSLKLNKEVRGPLKFL